MNEMTSTRRQNRQELAQRMRALRNAQKPTPGVSRKTEEALLEEAREIMRQRARKTASPPTKPASPAYPSPLTTTITNKKEAKKKRSEEEEEEALVRFEEKVPAPEVRAPTMIEERFTEIDEAYKLDGGDSDFLAYFLYDPHPSEVKKLAKQDLADTQALSKCQTLWHAHARPRGRAAQAELDRAELVQSASRAMPETVRGQATRLANAGTAVLCAAAEGPIAERVYAFHRWAAINVTVERCLDVAARALGNISTEGLKSWWYRYWNARLAPLAARTVALRADRHEPVEEAGGIERPRASWLPPSGGGPNEIGNAKRFISEAYAFVLSLTRTGTIGGPLAELNTLAYPAACPRACPCQTPLLLLAAYRAGILAPRPDEERDSATDEEWYVGIGGEENVLGDDGGTVAGVTMEGKQTVVYTPVPHIESEEYATVDEGCDMQWHEIGDTDEVPLGGGGPHDANIYVGSPVELVRSFAAMATLIMGRTYIDLTNGIPNKYEVDWAGNFATMASGSMADARRATPDQRLRAISERATSLVLDEDWWFQKDESQSLLVQACLLFLGNSPHPSEGLADRIHHYVGACHALVSQHTALALVYLVLLMSIFMSTDVDLVLQDIERTGRSIVEDEVLDELAEQAGHLRDALADVTSDVNEDARDRRQAAVGFLSYVVDVLQ